MGSVEGLSYTILPSFNEIVKRESINVHMFSVRINVNHIHIVLQMLKNENHYDPHFQQSENVKGCIHALTAYIMDIFQIHSLSK